MANKGNMIGGKTEEKEMKMNQVNFFVFLSI